MKRHHLVRALLISGVALVIAAPGAVLAGGAGLSVGPDVTIINLSGISNYTSSAQATTCPTGYTGKCRGYSVGTNSCNIGSVPVDWCDPPGGQTNECRLTTDAYHPLVATNSDHSVIAQNLYRLKGGRFEQVGMSFLKHGFVSTNSNDSDCAWNDNGTPNTACIQPPAGGDQLGLGCTDFYGSGLNGGRPLGRRSEVQIAGADHPTDPAGGETNDSYDQRIVVPEEDLDPDLNPGARYWVEGHYVVRDDARAGNGLNNASHREANVGPLPNLTITLTGPTVREQPAIFAWQAVDPAVEIVSVDRRTFFLGEPADVPATGQTYPNYFVMERFHAARRVTEPIGGAFQFHYEYAIHNMNSETSADGFLIQVPKFSNIGNVTFHDIDHHSGEPYDTTDWTIDVDAPNGLISWRAVDAGAATNALRWGTVYSFSFDSDSPPSGMTHQLSLFEIDEDLEVPFKLSDDLFSDGFETGDTSRWIGER